MRRRTGFFRAFAFSVFAFTAIMAGLLAVVGGVHHLMARAASTPFEGRRSTEQLTPPEPRLQTDPDADLQALEKAWTRRLTTYAWVDRQAGLARIPVQRAMQLMLRRGFPTRRGGRR